MMRTLLFALLVLATAQANDVFDIIVERNIFDPDRRPPAPVRSVEVAAPVEIPPLPVERLTLTGVVILGSEPVVYLAGSQGPMTIGQTFKNLTVKAISTEAVVLTTASAELTLKVGDSLEREVDGDWQPSEEGVEVPDIAPEASTPPEAQAEAGESDILKRLLERRKQELTP